MRPLLRRFSHSIIPIVGAAILVMGFESSAQAITAANNRVIPLEAGHYHWSTNFGVPGPMWSSGHHTGQDLGAVTGTKILAAADGVIEEMGDGGAYGNMTIVRVDSHTELLYAHQSRFLTQKGATVKAGQVIGLVGSTGNTTGPHLHFEVKIDGVQVDPKPWLRGAAEVAGTVVPGGVSASESPELAAAGAEYQAAQEKMRASSENYAKAVLIEAESRRNVDKATVEEMDSANIASEARTNLSRITRSAYMNTGSELSDSLQTALDGPEAAAGISRAKVAVDSEMSARATSMLNAQTVAEAKHQITVNSLNEYHQASADLETKTAEYVAATADAKAALAKYTAASNASIAAGNAPNGIQVSIGPDGCPTSVDGQWMRDGINPTDIGNICKNAVTGAPTPEAALALKYAFSHIGDPYACGGSGRLDPNRFDCSTLVSRAYREGAGLKGVDGGNTTVSLTRPVQPWLSPVSPSDIRPGDLVFYAHTGTDGSGASGHVVMAIGGGNIIDTGACGDGVRIQKLELNPSWTAFDGAYRVIPSKAR